MWGECFHRTRDRLLDGRRRIEALASDIGMESRPVPGEALAELLRPRRVVAIGEVNAGKSALLNAVARAEIAPSGPLPITRETTLYTTSKSSAAAEWQVQRVRAPGLEELEWVDTPGNNSDARDQVQAEAPLYEQADLLLVVFPSENTWTAASWTFVSELGEESLKRTALVIQRADRKNDEDLRVIRGHMTELCLKKVGRELPILAVAAQPADGEPELSALEDLFEEMFCRTSEARHRMDLAFQEALRRLLEIEAGLDHQGRTMADDGWFLTNLERESGELRDLLIEHSEKALAGERAIYQDEIARLMAKVNKRLGVLRTVRALLFGDSLGAVLETDFAERMKTHVEAFARRDFERIAGECEGHWSEVRPRVIERMSIEPGKTSTVIEFRETMEERFAAHVGRALPGVLDSLRIRAVIDGPARKRADKLKAGFAIWLLLVMAMGVCGTLGFDPAAWILAGAVVALGAGWMLAVWLSRRRLVARVREHLSNAVARFFLPLRDCHAEAIREVFEMYGRGLIGIRRRLADRQAKLAPRTEIWNRLHLELKAVEQEWD
ncbi:dynamin family protein [Haloferula sargassicola]|uniref:G domain-containing protein n=1 Tax=Haloferula sargassicola TaxID=490096 RepID=A0ABP9UVM6_9BACT